MAHTDHTRAPSTTAWLRMAVRALRNAGDDSAQPLLSTRWGGYDRRLAAHARRLGWVSAPQITGDGPAVVRILMPTV